MLVSEVCDLHVTYCTVGPRNDILLGLTSDNLKVVNAHKLPYNRESEFFISVLDVLSADSHKLQLELCTSIKSNLTVNTFLEVVVWILFYSVPFNNVRVDLMDDFEKNLTVPALLVEIVNINVFNI